MSAPAAYGDWLKQELGSLIDALGLPDLQKHFLRSRWLDQVAWMEGKANGARKQYNALRLTTIIGGVVIPVLVGLNVTNEPAAAAVRWGTVGLSLLVAISAAVEEFFRYGERWQHYRRTAELLKMEGWHFSSSVVLTAASIRTPRLTGHSPLGWKTSFSRVSRSTSARWPARRQNAVKTKRHAPERRS